MTGQEEPEHRGSDAGSLRGKSNLEILRTKWGDLSQNSPISLEEREHKSPTSSKYDKASSGGTESLIYSQIFWSTIVPV